MGAIIDSNLISVLAPRRKLKNIGLIKIKKKLMLHVSRKTKFDSENDV